MNNEDMLKEGNYLTGTCNYNNKEKIWIGEILIKTKSCVFCHVYLCNKIPESINELTKNKYIGLFGIEIKENLLSICKKEKAQLLMCKLEDLIDKSLENNDKHKFKIYSERYNKIKNKYDDLIKK